MPSGVEFNELELLDLEIAVLGIVGRGQHTRVLAVHFIDNAVVDARPEHQVQFLLVA